MNSAVTHVIVQKALDNRISQSIGCRVLFLIPTPTTKCVHDLQHFYRDKGQGHNANAFKSPYLSRILPQDTGSDLYTDIIN